MTYSATASTVVMKHTVGQDALDEEQVCICAGIVRRKLYHQLTGIYAMQMVKGDPGMEDIYKWTQNQINTPLRGRTGHGDGVHILTGPIYVCGAEAGDVLQVTACSAHTSMKPPQGLLPLLCTDWWNCRGCLVAVTHARAVRTLLGLQRAQMPTTTLWEGAQHGCA